MAMQLSGSLNLTGSLNVSSSVNLSGSIIINKLTYPTFGFADGQHGVEVPTLGVNNVFSMEVPKTVYEYVKNDSGVTLLKGTPVHSTGTVGFNTLVIAASASNASTMPATYILAQDLDDGEEGLGIAIGAIQGVNTTGLIAGDAVYVGANGGWTQTKPTGSNLIQNLGIVTKVGNNGGGVVLGAGRSNDVPNIQEGYFWVGNGSSVATATPTSSFELSGRGVVSSSQQIQNYNLFAQTSSANTFYGNQTVLGTLDMATASIANASFVESATFFDIDTLGGKKLRLNKSGNQIIMGTGAPVLVGSVTEDGTSNPLQVTGNQSITSGDLVFRTAGKGIDFSATSNGSGTTTSELLNDYETGTWSPQVYYQNATDQTNSTNVTQVGTYTKIGNVVVASGVLQWTITGSPANDNIGIKNFPFTSKSGGDNTWWGNLMIVNAGSYPTDGYILRYDQNATLALFYDSRSDTANYGDEIGATGTKTARFTITYLSA